MGAKVKNDYNRQQAAHDRELQNQAHIEHERLKQRREERRASKYPKQKMNSPRVSDPAPVPARAPSPKDAGEKPKRTTTAVINEGKLAKVKNDFLRHQQSHDRDIQDEAQAKHERLEQRRRDRNASQHPKPASAPAPAPAPASKTTTPEETFASRELESKKETGKSVAVANGAAASTTDAAAAASKTRHKKRRKGKGKSKKSAEGHKKSKKRKKRKKSKGASASDPTKTDEYVSQSADAYLYSS